MNNSHTPGPWNVGMSDGSGIKVYPDVEYQPVARINGIGPRSQANARLIAAAPQLLKAAERFLAAIENITTEDFSKGAERLEREALREAIAAATS